MWVSCKKNLCNPVWVMVCFTKTMIGNKKLRVQTGHSSQIKTKLEFTVPISDTSVRLRSDSLPHWSWAPPSPAGNATSGTGNGSSWGNEMTETRSFSISIAGCKSYSSHQATHMDTTLNPPQHTHINNAQMALGRDRETSLYAHTVIWGKHSEMRVQSSNTSDKCAFQWACNIAATLQLLISARTAVKKGTGRLQERDFWWLEQTWLAQ